MKFQNLKKDYALAENGALLVALVKNLTVDLILILPPLQFNQRTVLYRVYS